MERHIWGHTFNVQHWQRWLRLMNANKPTDIAVLHHYKTLSEEEWEYKTCGRNDGLTLNGLPMSCHGKTAKEALPITSPNGEIYDDTAWRILRSHVPSYRMYDTLGEEDLG